MIIGLFTIFMITILAIFFTYENSLETNQRSNRKKYIIQISIIFILISGLRNVAVGADNYAYSLMFDDVKKNSWNEVFEAFFDYYKYNEGKDPGYLIFQKTLQLFTNNYTVYLFFIAIIFFSALGNFIYQNTTRLIDVMLAFLIFVVIYNMFFSYTGHRQTIATAATIYSYELLKKRRIFWYFALIILAYTVHKSSIIVLPFYFIANYSKPKQLLLAMLCVFPVLMSIKFIFLSKIISLNVFEDYEVYEGAGTLSFTTIYILLCIIAIIKYKKLKKSNDFIKHYYNAFSITLLLLPLSWINPSAMRITMYFSIFMLLLIPRLINSIDFIFRKKEVYVFITLILIMFFIKAYLSNPNPYGFFWEEMRLPEHYFIRD